MLKTDLIKLIKSTTSLPSLPQVVTKVTELASRADTSASDIARFMEHDMSLTATILKVANSAAFGGAVKINSVAQAIARLGMREVTTICITLSVIKGMKIYQEIDCAKFWKHSISVGYACQLISDVSNQTSFKLNKELLFTAGLLHDIGIVVFLTIAQQEWLKAVEQASKNNPAKALWEIEQNTFNTDHAEIGAILLKQWQLPEEIISSAELHHCQEPIPENKPLVCLVRLANFICNNQGLEHGILTKNEPLARQIWEASGLFDESVPRIIAEVNSMILRSELLAVVGMDK
jgi:putative nucleotidyltransferase with HDIG domain